MATTRKNFHDVLRRRINWVLLFFYIAIAGLAGRFFILQILSYRTYTALAAKQHRVVENITGERGVIALQDKNGTHIPIAVNHVEKSLIVSPKSVVDQNAVADFITNALALSRDAIMAKLANKDDAYEVLGRNLDDDVLTKIGTSLPTGVYFEEEKRRLYPHGTLAAQVLGFVAKEDNQENGRYGLERFYEQDLNGEAGVSAAQPSTAGFWVALGNRIIHPPKNGSQLFLTIDYNIQSKAEDILQKTIEKWHSASGNIIVLDPTTGKILAMASYPSFDPNNFSKEKDYSVFSNASIASQYELGSVMKPVTMAAGLEEGKVRPDTTYYDTGEVKIGTYVIKNFDTNAYHTQTMTQVLEKSLNTGAVFVGRQLGHDLEKKYLDAFGFGQKTGIDLPSELPGNISNLDNGREIDFATASFGQGIAVTPLQMAMAISAIANDGKLMKPYVVDKIVDDSGNETQKAPQLVRQVVSSKTAEDLTKMLVSVVRNGFEDRAGVKGYFVAGKTGTAQVPNKNGRGYSDVLIHTFVGYAPAFQPKFLALIQLNEPQGNRFAANTLTPAFHDLADYILNYYEVPPDEK